MDQREEHSAELREGDRRGVRDDAGVARVPEPLASARGLFDSLVDAEHPRPSAELSQWFEVGGPAAARAALGTGSSRRRRPGRLVLVGAVAAALVTGLVVSSQADHLVVTARADILADAPYLGSPGRAGAPAPAVATNPASVMQEPAAFGALFQPTVATAGPGPADDGVTVDAAPGSSDAGTASGLSGTGGASLAGSGPWSSTGSPGDGAAASGAGGTGSGDSGAGSSATVAPGEASTGSGSGAPATTRARSVVTPVAPPLKAASVEAQLAYYRALHRRASCVARHPGLSARGRDRTCGAVPAMPAPIARYQAMLAAHAACVAASRRGSIDDAETSPCGPLPAPSDAGAVADPAGSSP